MIRRLTLSLLNILWKTTAVLVVTVAVLVSVVRLLLPEIARYREPIAEWVSRQVAQPVDFDNIEASWQGWVPVIKLTNVRLYAREGDTVITRFGTAEFSLDPLRSLQRREAVPGKLTVSGMRIALAHSDDGSVRLEGAGDETGAGSGLRQNALAYWLQSQPQLTIAETAIIWHDERLLKPLIFSNVALDIRSDGTRRQFEGRARLPGSPGSEFRFLLDAEGDLLTTAWSGEMYLEGHGIEPSALLEYRRWLGLEAEGGRVNFRFWSNWRNARITTVNGVFVAGGSQVGTSAERVQVEELRGTVQAMRTQSGAWQVAVDPLQVKTANGRWPESRIALAIKRGAPGAGTEVQLNMDYLKLDDLVPVVHDIAALPANLREAVVKLQPRGNLRDLRIHYSPAGPDVTTGVNVGFDELSFSASERFPGFTGLAGSLAADNSGGQLKLDSRGVTVDAPAVYDHPINVDTLQGSVALVRQQDYWQLHSNGLTLTNAELRTTVSGELALAEGRAPEAQLFARVDHLAPARIGDYLPRSGLTPKAKTWLSNAFRSGRVDSGGIVLRGPLDKFPFDNGEGRFEARLHVTDAELQFSPKWPVISDLNADVVLAGRRLTVYAPKARTLDAEITDTTAYIADLFSKDRTLLVDGQAAGTVAMGKEYARQSPVQDKVPELSALLGEAGRLDLQLSLIIPLRPTPNEVKGSAKLTDAVLKSTMLGGDITAVTGTVNFTRKSFDAKELAGEYAGEPVRMSFKGQKTGDTTSTEFRLSGNSDITYMRERLGMLTPALAGWVDRHNTLEQMRGRTDWQVIAQLTGGKGAMRQMTDLRIDSSLAGMAVNLPSPLGKPAGTTRPLHIHVDMAQPETRGVDFSLGADLNGILLLRPDAQGVNQLARAALQFGNATARLPDTDRIQIAGNASEIGINDWLDLLYERMELGSDTGRSSAPALPVSIDVTAARVEALGRYFDNVQVRGDSGAQAWQLQVAGTQLDGEVRVPHRLAEAITEVNLRRLQIPPRAVQSVIPVEVNPGRLPPVSIRCEDFAFQNVRFGRSELSTRPIANGLKLESLTFSSPASQIQAQGEWTLADEVHTSQFTIRVESEELAKLLEQFGYGVTAVENGKTAIDIEASWGGSPADFTLEKLNGSLAMTIKNGRFLDIDNPAAGRLFGLLSIQALPRRLTLDFNDLFKKGMGFERISGSFELDGGNAYTNNMVMHGSSARIDITGRTGLAGHDYDQLATVTPQISDSLPVASALFGPAGAGVGAAIFLGKQIIPELPEQIDKMLARQYTITGSWTEPKVEQVQSTTSTAPETRGPFSADG